MSIDPLKTNTPLQLSVQRSGAQETTAGQAGFEQLLETAQQLEKPPEQAAEQARKMMDLARLQLLQGLFQSDEESETQSGMFAQLYLKTPVAPISVAGSQQVDRLYRQMQPTLQEDVALERSAIEKMIDQVAQTVSLAPELIRSVVAAESDFRPQAVSHAGAQGLMQLMPATAKELGVEDSFDPQQNLLGGSRYLKQLLEKYDGDLDKSLAAYNWGQGNVDRKGLAQMPQETRNYLAKIKGMLADKA